MGSFPDLLSEGGPLTEGTHVDVLIPRHLRRAISNQSLPDSLKSPARLPPRKNRIDQPRLRPHSLKAKEHWQPMLARPRRHIQKNIQSNLASMLNGIRLSVARRHHFAQPG